ncbi:MAG: hypothetical protein IPM33_13210 [Phycisphaerales bacterium]|nr:hypothetical protein [Phycisphaerales bacterium]
MDVTSMLVKVFLVDKQLRGLRSRLDAADRFLGDQNKDLERLDTKRRLIEAQLKQAQVDAKTDEGEIARIDARMNQIREQMNSAQTNREYKAFLTELNTFKAERDRLETSALEKMTACDTLRAQIEELDAQRSQRQQVQGVAAGERTQRETEIRERLEALKVERKEASKDVPPEAMTIFERLVISHGDDAMAAVEVEDRRRHEFFCGGCRMTVPVESVSTLMISGKLTRCVSCQCLLYLDEAAREAMKPAGSKRG